MNPSLQRKLETIVERAEEVSALLADPEVIADGERFRELSVEYAQLNPVVNCFEALQKTREDEQSAQDMLKDPDPELRRSAIKTLRDLLPQTKDVTVLKQAIQPLVEALLLAGRKLPLEFFVD